MKCWVGLVGWLVADGLPILVVTHRLQVERRTGKVCWPKTDVWTTEPRHQVICLTLTPKWAWSRNKKNFGDNYSWIESGQQMSNIKAPKGSQSSQKPVTRHPLDLFCDPSPPKERDAAPSPMLDLWHQHLHTSNANVLNFTKVKPNSSYQHHYWCHWSKSN